MNKEFWLKKYIKDPKLLIEAIKDLESHDRGYIKAFDLGPMPRVIVDKDLNIVKTNLKAEKLLGHVAKNNLQDLIHHESIQSFMYFKNEFLKLNTEKQIYLWFFIGEEKKYISLTLSPLEKDLSQGIIIDESFTKETIENLEVKGFKDYLTGLYNRRFFHEEIQRLDVKRNYPLGLVMADLNGLKLVNDAFGHQQGDKLIKEVADVLTKTCREDDILARIGGDEFVVIIPKTEVLEMENLLKRIQSEVATRTVGDVQLSLATGYSLKTSEKEAFSHFFKRAEDLMYKDKLLNVSSQRADIIKGILSTLHEKHPTEALHSKNVSNYMVKFGEAMGFGKARLNKIESAGLLHDIGKIGIDYCLIEKPRFLNDIEMNVVQTHPEIGYRILKNTIIFGDIAEMILCHHEHVDGSGYPRGLRSNEIPLESRMLNICDAYDAMTSNEFYRESRNKDEAIAELKLCSGTQFDPLLLEIFITKVIC